MIDVQQIIDVAERAVDPVELTVGSVYAIATGNGDVRLIDLTTDQYRDQPKRATGTYTVRDVASFATYWAKQAEEDVSEIYADRDQLKVMAVLDAHAAIGPAGWRQHRLVLALQHSSAWKAWTGADGRPMDQETFAEFLEDNRVDIADPPAAEMLEIASSLQATTKAEFASGISLPSGQRKLSYVEDTTAKAGQRGDLMIPTEITLRLPVFDGARFADAVTARFRYRINGGKLSLHYKLDRPADVISAAFEGVVADVAEQCNTTVLRGTSA